MEFEQYYESWRFRPLPGGNTSGFNPLGVNFGKVSSASVVFLQDPNKQICNQRKLHVEIYERGQFQRRPLERKEEGKKGFHLCARNYAVQGKTKRDSFSQVARDPASPPSTLAETGRRTLKGQLRLRDIAPPFGSRNRATSCPGFFCKTPLKLLLRAVSAKLK